MTPRTHVGGCRRLIAGGVALACAVLAPALVGAADWQVKPRISASEAWSDNIELDASGGQHDFVTTVTPGVEVVGRGGRVELDLDYQLGLVHYARGGGGNRFDHRLQSDATVEVLKQRFFVDFEGTAGQVNVSSSGQLSDDTVTRSGNRSSFFTARVSPYLTHHFGRFADGVARFTHSRVNNSDSLDTNRNDVAFTLTSGRAFPQLPWTLGARYSRTSNSTGSSSSKREVNGSVRYNFTRHYGVRLTGGYEDNEGLVSSRGDSSSLIWRVAGVWTPSPRTELEVGYGRRFFGNSFSVDLSHQAKRLAVTASYNEDSTTSAEEQLDTDLFDTVDAFGDEIDDAGLDPEQVSTNSTTLGDETVIARRFAGTVSLRARRTTTTVRAFHDRRAFELSGNDETVFGLSSTINHALNRTTNAALTGSWQRSDFTQSGRSDDRWQVGLSLSRRIYRDVNGTLGYTHRENDSSDASGSYKENRVNARLSVVF